MNGTTATQFAASAFGSAALGTVEVSYSLSAGVARHRLRGALLSK